MPNLVLQTVQRDDSDLTADHLIIIPLFEEHFGLTQGKMEILFIKIWYVHAALNYDA